MLARAGYPVEAPPATAAPPAVVVTGLAKRFAAGPPVFAGLDLAIRPGEAVAIIGANGTGKSTLLRCLVRLTEPSEGSIEALGERVTSLSGAALRRYRARVGFVFQRHNLVARLSALTNVVHGAQSRLSGPRTWLQGLAPAEVRAEAAACLARVGLADRALQRADSLSGGQSQRVAVARMLMQRPQLVIADEPDASLDPRSGAEVMELLLSLSREAGLTLVFVSHHMDHAVRFSDRIVGLAHGGVALDAPSRDTDPRGLRRFFEG